MPDSTQWRMDACSIQGDGEWNEDALAVNEAASVYGVVDGATSLSAYRNVEGKTGGYIAAQLAAAHFIAMEGRALEQTAVQANLALQEAMAAEGVDLTDASGRWSAALVIVQIHEFSIDYVQAGDCMLLGKYRDGTLRALTHSQLAHVDKRTVERMQELRAEGVENPAELRRRLMPLLQDNRKRANTLEGYGVLNGDPRFPQFLERGTFNRANLESLYMFTDGLYTGAERWEDVINGLDTHGAEGYARELYRKEQADRLLLEVPRLKVSDDKSCVVLHLDGSN
ncbi:protein phosphatase 2C domain-containing protein [Paenibacillus sp. S150]|uniref:protein phosphatase 2C domain-containing protein n=1 Tax=Paenibacillus sp. S150 TaxID=2749826 RepID=UPI001C599BE3|nr:protein phosphatase 2C domain-containing protein [Paenibacillus sp. S150]MBW4084747.1 protein phosphatase 2C domain-containing protein [Paenibacillus sp. S150]